MKFENYKYIPLIATRISEMKALEELPIEAKNGVLPYVVLQQWATSRKLVNTTTRLEAAFGARPVIVDITAKVKAEGKRYKVHDELDSLRDPSNGYKNWYDFLEGFPNYIPSLQISSAAQIPAQISRVVTLGRGLAVKLHKQVFDSAEVIAQLVAPQLRATPVIFMLDYGHSG